MPQPSQKKPKKLTPAQKKAWLKGKGHDNAKVDKEKWTNDAEADASIRKLHGVSDEEFRRAGGQAG